MLANHDEVSRAVREQVSWQLAVGTMFGDTLVQGMRQVAELNMGMLRLTLEQSNFSTRQLAAARDTRQFLSLAAAQVHPGVKRALDYGYYMVTIIAEMQGGMLRVFASQPDPARHWERLARPGEVDGWRAMSSFFQALTGSAFRFPADAARAGRLALNLNAPAWESGKLRIAYARRGR
ncbi:phasin family protein [Noviherbaspirillum sp. ST9]|uniref:phasin family protein n=1 Tax=Noviherbaspirillum sp. ST9 TaxID=3401606 RepID=UPI003B58A8C8